MSTPEAVVAGAIDAHSFRERHFDCDGWCACGWFGLSSDHTAHVAAVVIEQLGLVANPNRILLAFNGQRIFDVTGVSIDIVHQDDGLTLKVLVTDLPVELKARATTDHMARFGQSLNLDGSTQP